MTEPEADDRPDPDASPSIVRKAAGFAAAAARHLADGAAHVPQEIYEARLSICRSCDRLDAESMACLECGCRLLIKARWRSEDCPLGRWPAAELAASGAPEGPTA